MTADTTPAADTASAPGRLAHLKPSRRNATAAAAALLVPLPLGDLRSAATGWGHVLHLAADQQSPQAAWGLAVLALAAAAACDRARRTWLSRALLWAAVIGMLLAPPAVREALTWITGAAS